MHPRTPASRLLPALITMSVLAGAFGGPVAAADPSPGARPWLDTSLTVDQRIAALLPQMTLDEKIGQMTQIDSDSIDPDGTAAFLLGSILASGGGNPHGQNTA